MCGCSSRANRPEQTPPAWQPVAIWATGGWLADGAGVGVVVGSGVGVGVAVGVSVGVGAGGVPTWIVRVAMLSAPLVKRARRRTTCAPAAKAFFARPPSASSNAPSSSRSQVCEAPPDVVAWNCTGSPGAGASGAKVNDAVGSAPCAGAETSSSSASATARISFGFMNDTVSERRPPAIGQHPEPSTPRRLTGRAPTGGAAGCQTYGAVVDSVNVSVLE